MLLGMLIAFLGIIGWVFDWGVFTHWGGKGTMKMATCSCLLGLGQILCFRDLSRASKLLCDIASAIIVVYILGITTEIPYVNVFVFETAGGSYTLTPGIPSISTTFLILFWAFAVEFRSWRSVCSLLSITLGVICLIGQAIDNDLMIYYVNERSTAMSIPTALIFIFYGVFIFYNSYPDHTLSNLYKKLRNKNLKLKDPLIDKLK